MTTTIDVMVYMSSSKSFFETFRLEENYAIRGGSHVEKSDAGIVLKNTL